MNSPANPEAEKRVLLLTPTGRDAELIGAALDNAGIKCETCSDMQRLCAEIRKGAATAVIAEEAFSPESFATLSATMQQQPAWSDLPIIVLTSSGESTPFGELKLNALAPLGNVSLVERPIRPATLMSLVRSAVRARRRQHEVRELVFNLNVIQERLRRMIESAQDYAIISVDCNRLITYWNTGAERLLGYSEQEVLGQCVDMIFTEEDRLARLPEQELRTAESTGRAESEGWRIRRDGSMFWGSGVVTPVRNGTLPISAFVKVLRDMTAQKQTAERLSIQAKQLQRSNEDLQRFAYLASHDLQEPLRMVSSYSQLLAQRNKNLDQDSHQFIAYVLAGVERMRNLIQDLLEFSRVSNDAIQTPSPVDCNAILKSALLNLQPKIRQSGAIIHNDDLPTVLAHDSRLLQVFQNLIENAIKYSKDRPEIRVSAKYDGTSWVISVQDNGIGIPPQYHEKIFGLFQRLHSQQEYPGTGLGLAICKRVIEQLGGRIWVDSDPGHGSTFSFTLSPAESVERLNAADRNLALR
jgi:PAS domain S-box-containing protein